MKRAHVLLIIGLVLAAGAGWWGYQKFQSLPFKIVLRGSGGTSGPLGVSGGHLVVVTPRPGVFFGTVTRPGSPEEFTYLILFRYGPSGSEGSSRRILFDCSSEGRKAETKDSIEFDGKRLEAAYRIDLGETPAAPASEALEIGGKSVDMAAGRLFLIDFASEAPAYRQKKVDLPAIPFKLQTTEDVERLAESVRKSLEGRDPEIETFLR
jgi:hypothetical protein